MIPIIRRAQERRQWKEGRKGSEKSLTHSFTHRSTGVSRACRSAAGGPDGPGSPCPTARGI